MNSDATPPDSFLNENLSELFNRDLVAEWANEWIGREVGSYRLDSLAGHGSYGVVFKGKRTEPYEEIVAVKLMPFRTGGLKLTSQFQRECQTLADLSDPNIAAILSAGITEENVPYLAMPFIDGKPIDDVVAEQTKESGKPNWRQIAELLTQLCSAIQYAHQEGVIHCDLKPDNVLVTESGQLFVTDLGLAVRLDQLDETVSRGSWSPGTVGYSAPEIVASRQTTSKSVDIYSIGAILYKLLTGQTPHGHSGWLESLIATVQEPPVPVSVRMPEVPRSLATICDRCLHRDPQKRYGSASDLAGDLQRYLDGESIRQFNPDRSPAAPRNRKPWVVLACSLLLLICAGWQLARSGVVYGLVTGKQQANVMPAENEAELVAQINEIRQTRVLPASRSPKEPGDLQRKYKVIAKATAEMESILVQAPANPTIRQRTGDAQHFLGIAASHTQLFAEAERAYLRCQQLFDSLAVEFPANVDYKFSQFSTRLSRASLCGKTMLRSQLHEECLDIIKSIVELEPNNVDYIDALAAAYGTVAIDCQQVDGRSDLRKLQQMAQECRKWAQKSCGHPDAKPLHRKHLVNSARLLSFVEDQQHRHSKATEWSEEAVIQCRQLLAEYQNPTIYELLVDALCEYASLSLASGDKSLASALLDEADNVLTELRGRVPEWSGIENRQKQVQSVRDGDPVK